VRVPEWHILAAASGAVALVVLGLLYLNSDSLRNRGRSLLAVVVYATATIAVWVIYDFTQQYMTLSSVIAGVLLLLGMLGVMLVLLAESHEWAEAQWVEYRPRLGALNYALARTAPDAEIVAVIDSDYVVDARWLRDLTPAFRDQRLAIVQAPQDYRDEGASAFKAMCYAEYRGFFHIGMITRNERN